MNSKIIICILLLSSLLQGCSTLEKAEEMVADIEQVSVETRVFDITPVQAESIIKEAFSEGWPDKELSALDNQENGYEITLWFAIDRERIKAKAVQAEVGYRFEVTNRGTAPVVGVPARKKLLLLIEKHATKAEGLTQTTE